MPRQFTEWTEKNAQRLENAKNKPYFITDNYVDGDVSKGLRFERHEPITIKPETPDKRTIAQRREEFERYRNNPDYKDKEFNEKTGAIKATHINHNKHSNDKNILIDGLTGDQLEKECQDELFRMEHKAILRDESKRKLNGEQAACLDLELDDKIMDIVSVTEYNGKYGQRFAKKDKQIKRAQEQSGDISDSLCVYFHAPSMFHEDVFVHDLKWYKKYKEGHTQRIRHVYVVIKGEHDIKKFDI